MRSGSYRPRIDSMSYRSETIDTVINRLNRQYYLPAIQREFVWKPEQIAQLFDSILRGYPISSFLFWDLKPENRDKWQAYKFLETARHGGTHNELAITDVLASYGEALEYLDAIPYFVDVESFCRQAFTDQLPPLRCVFNLNAGITPISNWALVPSTCQWKAIPVLPCSADTIILGERKDLSTLVARTSGFPTPRQFRSHDEAIAECGNGFLRKPRDLGGSVGITHASDARRTRRLQSMSLLHMVKHSST